jgi:hypothetical protein
MDGSRFVHAVAIPNSRSSEVPVAQSFTNLKMPRIAGRLNTVTCTRSRSRYGRFARVLPLGHVLNPAASSSRYKRRFPTFAETWP